MNAGAAFGVRVRAPPFGLVFPVLAALVLPGGPAVGSDAAAPRPVKTVVVQAQPTEVRRSYPAVVLPGREVELSFRVSGQIVALPIRGALRVEKGDVVAALDPRDFEAELARLESQLAQAKAQLRALTAGARAEDVAALEAEVTAARAEADAAAADLERSRTLFQRNTVSKARLDNDRMKLRRARSALEAKTQKLAKGRAGARKEEVDAQQAAVEGLESAVSAARETVADATLRAPFGGIIARRLVENFANVQAKEPVAVLHKLDTLLLSFDVPGPDVTALAGRGDLSPVALLHNLPGREFAAKLDEFSTEADPATQTFRGRVAIEVPEDTVVLPGMTGSVVVTDIDEARGGYWVPLSALAAGADGAPFVWVVAGAESRVSMRPVAPGEVRGSAVAIIEGLNEGDVVVTAGVPALRRGMMVRPVAAVAE